jgi:hypothetical protein
LGKVSSCGSFSFKPALASLVVIRGADFSFFVPFFIFSSIYQLRKEDNPVSSGSGFTTGKGYVSGPCLPGIGARPPKLRKSVFLFNLTQKPNFLNILKYSNNKVFEVLEA